MKLLHGWMRQSLSRVTTSHWKYFAGTAVLAPNQNRDREGSRPAIHIPPPYSSLTLIYRSAGGFTTRCVFPLGSGHVISTQSTFAAPPPRISRGSCDER